jgi:(5-formylfuran-3-yl)methyl phosphate synthase
MQLLVSVRSADEVESALTGGADIIDAKEPSNGSLGAVSPATLADLASRVPSTQELSVALGDIASLGEVITLIDQLRLPTRTAPTYLKVGFAGVRSEYTLRELLSAAVERSISHQSRLSIIAVAYADADRAAALPADVILRSAADAGAGGVLVDTHLKDGSRLLDWWTPERLASWVSLARASGLLAGVAGSLRADDAVVVARADPDVVGFRGAACDSGRLGHVTVARVALLRRCIDSAGTSSDDGSAYIADAWRNA